MAADKPNFANVKALIDKDFKGPERTRMIAQLLENQTLDTWMTYELFQAGIKWVRDKGPLGIKLEMDDTVQTRDQESSTTAELLKLGKRPVGSFCNFQSIRFNGMGQPAMRHQNRPDGMCLLRLECITKGKQDMVLFYEGDVHAKDDGKTLTSGCRNSQKMYQAIAQAQSKNDLMAGCAIFAAMKDAPIDKMLNFLDDMLKAHILVCIAIADWNSHIQAAKRVETLIGSLFGNSLHHSTLYDFVFGINIGLEQGTPSFNEEDFRHRIRTMLAGMGFGAIGADNIDVPANMKRVAEYRSTHFNIGCVKIVICAIPRQKPAFLAGRIIQPMFIYPLHVGEIVHFDANKSASIAAASFNNRLTFTGNNTTQVNYTFKKSMMKMTAVYVNAPAGGLSDTSCLLRETNGFFYVALPFAYYTIQQFEFVNAALDYSWSPVRYDFRAMLRAFKTNKKNLTGDLQVTMFRKSKSSLFHIICESVDDLPELSADFEFFLAECCRWVEAKDKHGNALAKYTSPKIIFRTLGIFSLQNAIDFACDIRANPNKTYSSLLASYPAGAQTLIQQCMKRLSGNEAYAYVGRTKDVDTTTQLVLEQPDSDDDTANTGPDTLAKRLLRLEKTLHTKLFHSTWSVAIGAAAPAPAPAAAQAQAQAPAAPAAAQAPAAPAAAQAPAAPAAAQGQAAGARRIVLALQLLKEYQKTVVSWDIAAVDYNGAVDFEANAAKVPGDDLRIILTEHMQQKQFMAGNMLPTDLQVPARLFEPEVSYKIFCSPRRIPNLVTYICTARSPDTVHLSSDTRIDEQRGAQYTAEWGTVPITFTLVSRTVRDGVLQGAASLWDRMANGLDEWLMRDGEPADLIQLLQEMKVQERQERVDDAAEDAANRAQRDRILADVAAAISSDSESDEEDSSSASASSSDSSSSDEA